VDMGALSISLVDRDSQHHIACWRQQEQRVRPPRDREGIMRKPTTGAITAVFWLPNNAKKSSIR